MSSVRHPVSGRRVGPSRKWVIAAWAALTTPTFAGYTLSTIGSPGASYGNLVMDGAGNLYGLTKAGGATGDGTVYQISATTDTLTTLATFDGTNGSLPAGNLQIDAAGNLYGSTVRGGPDNHGTVFEVPAGSNSVTTLASFDGADGANPYNGVVLDTAGNLYGTNYFGGESSAGTVFKVAATTHALSTVVTFNGSNGSNPDTVLKLDSSGNLYGTTVNGGANNQGTVFKIGAGSGQVTTLASFDGNNGSNPGYENSVVLDPVGNIFTTATFGGPYAYGTYVKVAAGSNTATSLASFNGANGAYPAGGLTADSAGDLFGVTYSDSTSRFGKVFEIPAGSSSITVVAAFDGNNLAEPVAGLTIDGAGNLYGTTSIGVFEASPYTRTIYFASPSAPYDGNYWNVYSGGTPASTSPTAGDLAVLNNGGTVTYAGRAATFSTGSTTGQGLEVNSGTVNWNVDSDHAGPANALQFNTGGTLWVTNVGVLNLGVPLVVGAGGIVNVDGGSLLTPQMEVDGGNVVITGGAIAAASYNQSAGSVRMSGGSLTVAAFNLAGPAASFSWTGGAVAVTGPDGVTSTGLGDIAPGKTLTVAATLTVPADSTFNITGGAVTAGNVSGGMLSLSAGRLSTKVLSVASLSVAGTGQIDVGSRGLIDTDPTSLAALTALAGRGFDAAGGGDWNGPAGLVSSTAAADSTRLTAVGVVQNNQGGSPLFTASRPFLGMTPGASDVLVRYTYFGDANLDGTVDGSDYSLIDFGFLSDQTTPGSATGWYNGDFNYDGLIDSSDYTLIDNAFNRQAGLASASDLVASPTALATPMSAVPEPSALLAFTAAATGLRRRQRRHARC